VSITGDMATLQPIPEKPFPCAEPPSQQAPADGLCDAGKRNSHLR
jgi:hypothetical protein